MNGWYEVELGEVVTLQRGYDLTERERKPGKVPVVSSAGISGYHNEVKVSGPGVVTGRYGTLGAVYYIEEDFWPHNTTLFVKDFHGNDRRFAYYLLGSLNLAYRSAVSAVPGVNRNDLHRLPVLLPPLPTQRRIAQILGRLDDKIEVNRRTNRTLEAMAQALFKHWFVDFGLFQNGRFVESELGLVPEGWEVKPLSSLFQLLSGGTPRTSIPEYWGGNISWVAAKDVASATPFIMTTEKTITLLGVENSSTRLLPQFTTIITARGTVGALGLLPYEMAMNQTNYGLRGRGSIGLFTTYLLAKHAVENLRKIAYGTVFDTITRATFNSVSIASPPENVWTAFEKIVHPWFSKILNNQLENVKLAATRDYLLPRLLNGEVGV